MGAQNRNDSWKKVVGWILAIIIFFACDGLQTTARWLDFFNIPVPRVIIIGFPPITSQSKSESLTEEDKREIESKFRKQPVLQLTQQQQEERDKLIMKRAKEDGLNPTTTLEAYIIAKDYIETYYSMSENQLYENLRHDGYSRNEIKVAISWLINFREIEFDEQRRVYQIRKKNNIISMLFKQKIF